MKSISVQAIIEGVRAKKDRSLGLTISTPELDIQEKALFLELQGILVDLIIKPRDEKVEEEVINKDLEQKSQGQRIRSVLFILWKQNSEGMDFEQFYKSKTEKYLEYLKGKIDN